MAVTIRRETRDRGGDLLEGWAVFDGDDYVAAFYGPDAKLDAQAHRSADGKAGTMYQRLINGLDPGKTFRSLSGVSLCETQLFSL